MLKVSLEKTLQSLNTQHKTHPLDNLGCTLAMEVSGMSFLLEKCKL
jgi:hypothetical protein